MKKEIMAKTGRLNQSGMALIWVYLLSAFLTTMIYSFYSLNIWQTKTDVVDSSSEIQAFYLAETAIDDMYKYINDQIQDNQPISGTINRSDDLGTGRTFSSSYNPTTNMINAIGTVSAGNSSIVKKLYTKIVIGTPYDIPPGVQAGFTAGSAVEMSGLLIIDGRNHSSAGEVIDEGAPGVSYYQNADSPEFDDYVSIGGPSNAPNEFGVPVDPTSIAAVESNSNLLSPESVFGLSSGDLDPYKVSTPPSSTVNGLYYYEAPPGSGGSVNINLGNKDAPGSGVLIIDNAANPTSTVDLSGIFTGILIVRNGNYNLEANTMLSGALVNVSSSNSSVILSGPAYNPDAKEQEYAQILYCVECVEGSELPQGLNNSTIAGIGSWVNFRTTTTSNPLATPAITNPATSPLGDLSNNGGGSTTTTTNGTSVTLNG